MRNLLLIFICIIFFSCSTKQNETHNTPSYIIDIDKAVVEEQLLYSTVFHKMKTIILETSEQCLISMIDKMEVYNDYIIILDTRAAKSVFVFDKEGKFIKKIGTVGAGPGEFIYPVDITIDSKRGEIYILDFSSQKILRYHISTGAYLSTINIHRADGNSITKICYVNDILYTDAAFPNQSSTNYLMQALNASSGEKKNVYFTTEYTNKGWYDMYEINSKAFHHTGKRSLFNQYFMDTVVSLMPQVDPFFIIQSNKLPTQKDMEKFASSDFSNRHKIDKITDLNKFIEYKDFIFFEYRLGFPFKNIIYNKKTGETFQYKYITNDFLFNIRDYTIPIFGYAASEGLYTFYEAGGIDRLIFFIEEGWCSDKLDRKEEILNLDEDTNPIIFYFEYKDLNI